MTEVDQFTGAGEYVPVRILSERERSKVFLARDANAILSALKIQIPSDAAKIPQIIERYKKLQDLSTRRGFVPLMAYGAGEKGWFWEVMKLADNLPGLMPQDSQKGIEQYTPLTLRSWVNEKNSVSAQQVGQWGISLAEALATLHENNLVHRDVKPANILFLEGQPCLGDYGLVGEPGGEADFCGTEGFQPLEGTTAVAADLFGLGKTLYEAWTGLDRLEFPSLPRWVIESKEWNGWGKHLNRVLLHACQGQPGKRFQSAREFQAALRGGPESLKTLNRRRWLKVAGASSVVIAAGIAGNKLLHAPAKAVWKKVRDKGFTAEKWEGTALTADWNRRRMYSFWSDGKSWAFESLGLDRFDMEEKEISDGPKSLCTVLLHPNDHELWGVAEKTGEVFTLDLDSHHLKWLGGTLSDLSHFSEKLYWNPVKGVLGCFEGYGNLAVHNHRFEFDVVSGQWKKVEPRNSGAVPWPRYLSMPLVPNENGTRLFMVGGSGSPSGKQGEVFSNLKGFDGQFHHLDDVWELDLARNAWRQWLEVGHLDPSRLRVAIYHPSLGGLVLMEGSGVAQPRPERAKTFLFRPGTDHIPKLLPAQGDVSLLATVEGWTLDPGNKEILLLAGDGIFRVGVQPD